jgi:hypothetical protein
VVLLAQPVQQAQLVLVDLVLMVPRASLVLLVHPAHPAHLVFKVLLVWVQLARLVPLVLVDLGLMAHPVPQDRLVLVVRLGLAVRPARSALLGLVSMVHQVPLGHLVL